MARKIAETPKKTWTKPELKQIRAGSAEATPGNVVGDHPNKLS